MKISEKLDLLLMFDRVFVKGVCDFFIRVFLKICGMCCEEDDFWYFVNFYVNCDCSW